ncbi:Nodulation protein D 2 [compost metagenome]
MQRNRIYTDHLVCLMSARHPLAGAPLTLDDYCAYPHVVNSAERGQMINDLLAAQGRFRRIRLEVSLYQSALRLVSDSDSLATVTTHVARQFLAEQDLYVAELPFATPELEHGFVWPARLDNQASHRWLRETLADELRQIMAGSGSRAALCSSGEAQG